MELTETSCSESLGTVMASWPLLRIATSTMSAPTGGPLNGWRGMCRRWTACAVTDALIS